MRRFLVLLLFGALIIAACGTDEDADTPAASVPVLPSLDGSWVLATATIDDVPLTLNDEYRITMTIAGNEIGGRAACNSYGGSVTIDTGSFSVGPISQTEMACEPDVMDLEARFLSGLIRVTAAERIGDIASLRGSGVDLRFDLLPPVPTAALVGASWVLESVVEGETVTSPAAAADPATFRLESDGTFTGSTGCRTLSGEYVISGDTVLFTSFGADGECRAGVERQDNQVVTVLGDGFTASIEGDRLTLTASGGEGLVYRAADGE